MVPLMKRAARGLPASILGFSLAELLIALSISGIIAGLSISSYRAMVKSQALQSAAIATAAWLEQAQKQAMQQNSPCTLSPSPATNRLQAGASNSCGAMETVNLNEIGKGIGSLGFCFRSIDPLIAQLGCTQTSASSTDPIVFSPRGTVSRSAVFEFYAKSESAKTCTIILAPIAIIRHGRIRDGFCDASN